jgi:hypothetical protein
MNMLATRRAHSSDLQTYVSPIKSKTWRFAYESISRPYKVFGESQHRLNVAVFPLSH